MDIRPTTGTAPSLKRGIEVEPNSSSSKKPRTEEEILFRTDSASSLGESASDSSESMEEEASQTTHFDDFKLIEKMTIFLQEKQITNFCQKKLNNCFKILASQLQTSVEQIGSRWNFILTHSNIKDLNAALPFERLKTQIKMTSKKTGSDWNLELNLSLAVRVQDFLRQSGCTNFSAEDLNNQNIETLFKSLAKNPEFFPHPPCRIKAHYQKSILLKLKGLSLSTTKEEIKEKLQQKSVVSRWTSKLDVTLIKVAQEILKANEKTFSSDQRLDGFFESIHKTPALAHFSYDQVNYRYSSLEPKLRKLTTESSIEEIEEALKEKTPQQGWSEELDLALITAAQRLLLEDRETSFSNTKRRGFFQSIKNVHELAHFSVSQIKDRYDKCLAPKLGKLTTNSSEEKIKEALKTEKLQNGWSEELNLSLVMAAKKLLLENGKVSFSEEKPDGFFKSIRESLGLTHLTLYRIEEHYDSLAPRLKELTTDSSMEEVKEALKRKAPKATWSDDLNLILIKTAIDRLSQEDGEESFSVSNLPKFIASLEKKPQLDHLSLQQIQTQYKKLARKLKELTIHSPMEEIEKALKAETLHIEEWPGELHLLLIERAKKFLSDAQRTSFSDPPRGFFEFTAKIPELAQFSYEQIRQKYNALSLKLKELTTASSTEEIKIALETETLEAKWSYDLNLELVTAVQNFLLQEGEQESLVDEKRQGFFHSIAKTPALAHLSVRQIQGHYDYLKPKLQKLTIHSSIEEIEEAIRPEIKWTNELDLCLIETAKDFLFNSGIERFYDYDRMQTPQNLLPHLRKIPTLADFNYDQIKYRYKCLASKLKELTTSSSIEEIKKVLKLESEESSWDLDLL
jgi:hypothetical protein